MLVKYHPVSQSQGYTDVRDSLSCVQSPRSPSRWGWHCLWGALVISLLANGCFIYMRFLRPWVLAAQLPTRFAGLRWDKATEILADSDYSSINRTVQDAAWSDVDLEPWNGFLALDEDYTIAQGLPHSQRWPWDSLKGVYIMTSSHELHCVHVLRDLVNEDHDGIPESERKYHYPHVMHCLNVLRESVMCHADDTPLYIGRLHKNIHEKSPRAGTGTVKMCRDWDSLLAWSRTHSACYRPVHMTDDDFREVDRYKTCPDHSRPWEQMEGSKS
ncbi:hypothetical protein F5Y18DRAFT_244934 [Xylariaceae sp. FL1019]|nr:hypothetical protein F5Y18DRAFT_244934 [Xylariaceae sp. FL1019]